MISESTASAVENSKFLFAFLHYLFLISSVKIDDLGPCLKASYLTLINLTVLMTDSIVLASVIVFQSLLPKYIVSILSDLSFKNKAHQMGNKNF